MSWKRWLPDYKVPKTVDNLVEAGILKDKTSNRDIVPHFETTLHDGSEIVLWVDHPDVEWRAAPNGPRYGIEIYQKEELPKTVFSSNRLQETLSELQNILQRQGMGCL